MQPVCLSTFVIEELILSAKNGEFFFFSFDELSSWIDMNEQYELFSVECAVINTSLSALHIPQIEPKLISIPSFTKQKQYPV